MGRKNTLNKYPIISNGDMTTNITSQITDIQFLDNIAIQVNITSGSPSGTFYVQVSNDHATSGPTNVTTVPGTFITIAQTTVTAGSPANIMFNLTLLGSPYIQLFYQASGGTGTCDAIITGKAI